MSPNAAADYARRIEDDLRGNILPFWMARVVDADGRAFFGSLTNDLGVDRAAERGALLTTRIL
jgi:mannose/cellobiose epimerase-like protein (N-acyl-D-glucosamine 2-epimerase family)